MFPLQSWALEKNTQLLLKQNVAQQEAQRAAFVVDRAIQEKQQKIVHAEGEAQAAKLLGEAIGQNPGYLKLRKIRASQAIARTVSQSPNKLYLSGNSLMLNINDHQFDEPLEKLGKSKKFWISKKKVQHDAWWRPTAFIKS